MISRIHGTRARCSHLSSGLVISIALVACGAPHGQSEWNDELQGSNANPASEGGALLVELSPRDGAGGEVEYRLTNTSSSRVRFFASDTAANGDLIRNLFDVRLDDEAAAFAGPHVYLAPPKPADFTELAPGATLTTVIRLPDYYEMDRPGTYSVRALAVAPTVLHADQTSAPGALSVPASEIAVDVDGTHVHQVPDADLVLKASGVCESDCQLQCALSNPADPTFCIAECIEVICNGKIRGCSTGDRAELEDGEDQAAGLVFRAFSGLSSGTEFTTEFGARNDGKIALVRSVLNDIQGDLPTIPYDCNGAGAVVGSSAVPGVDFVCAPRTNFSQREVLAVTTQQPNARVEVCPDMLADLATTAGVMVHESSHHFGTVDGDANPLNDPEAYRRYVLSFR
jgi:hypothetical protein